MKGLSVGAPGWDRTSNPCLRRAVLYPLSYGRDAGDSISGTPAARRLPAGRNRRRAYNFKVLRGSF